LSREGWDEEQIRLGGCSYSPKGGMDDAYNLSREEVHGDHHHRGNPQEGSQRKKQPPLEQEVTEVLRFFNRSFLNS